ncbi:MAG: hypothetical protein JOZ69_18840, partial [Myxococcales bacterium]|nr:hypothetical protein [Myxococcales bacterium]
MLRLAGSPAGAPRLPGLLFRLAAALLASTAPVPAFAAAPSPAQLESARKLFAQAEADEDAGRWSDALDKLRAVSEVKLTPGIRYHVALCEEHLGKLAQALADYRASDAQARAEKAKDVLRLVGKQLAALDHRVPRLTVHVVPDLPDATVSLDGEAVGRSTLGTAIAVDPGVHKVEAVAPDRPVASVMVTLQEHDSTVLELHLAEPGAAPGQGNGGSPSPEAPRTSRDGTATAAPASATSDMAPAPTAEPSPAVSAAGADRAPDHGAAIAVSAVTAALVAGGVVFFVVAGNEHDSAVSACGGHTGPPTDCDPWRERVRAWDLAAAGAWAGAVAGAATAIVLWSLPAARPRA